MSKQLLLFVIFLFCFITVSFGQLRGDGNVITKSIDIPYFDEIIAKGNFQLEIRQGNQHSLELIIDSNLTNYILTQVTKQRLFIEVPDNIRKVKQILLIVTINDLNKLTLLGAVDATTDTLRLKNAEFFVSGTSDLDLNLVSTNFNMEITDVANVHINGATDRFDIRITDEAILDSKHFQSNFCDLKASGFSDISVNVQKVFDFRVTGVGNIYYYGDPDINNTINSGTAFIIKRRLD